MQDYYSLLTEDQFFHTRLREAVLMENPNLDSRDLARETYLGYGEEYEYIRTPTIKQTKSYLRNIRFVKC